MNPPKDQSHIASGLKIAQSQAMAVAGFLPAEHHTNCGQHKASKQLPGHCSVGSESQAGTDTTSLDAADVNSSFSVNRPVSFRHEHRASFHGRG